MMELRIAVCDDAEEDRTYVSGLVRDWAAQAGHQAEITAFSSAESFLFRYAEDKNWDILLLDIEMGAMDGVSLAKRVRKDNEAVQIVFVTGYSDYIAEGYEVAALNYLMKPIREEKLFVALDRAAEQCRQNEKCLNLELSGELVRIPLYEIRYLDVHQNYVTVHAGRDYTLKRPLGEFERELGPDFFRAGRGLIVSLRQVRRVTRTEVTLAGGVVLPLPRGAYEPLNRAIIART